MSLLTLKGHAGEIELAFCENVSIDAAKEEICSVKEEFFTKTDFRLCYSGIELSYNEEMELESVVKQVFGKECTFVKKHKLSRRQISYSLENDEVICRVIHKTLRSGEKVMSDGDIIIYGDVNPGASVTANGNVTVIGSLRGTVSVKENGSVYAVCMQPSQISIGKVYSYNKTGENVGQAIARSENGEIILQRL